MVHIKLNKEQFSSALVHEQVKQKLDRLDYLAWLIRTMFYFLGNGIAE